MYKHILVAVDLMPTCEQTVKKAIALSKLCSAKTHLVHIIEQMPSYGYPAMVDLDSIRQEEAKKWMSELGAKFAIDTAFQHVRIGHTKTDILAVAHEINADCLVIGRHSRHGLARLLGSTAQSLVNHAHCDILTVHLSE